MAFSKETLAKARATRAANAARKAAGNETAEALHQKEVTARNFPQARPITARSRVPRDVANRTERRRRKPGSLNRMAQMKLDIFTADQQDPDYIYRWVTDETNRLRIVTRLDDYDYVNASEFDGFNAEDETDSEGGERLRMIVGEKKNGQPIYSYLLKKRRDFWEEDNRLGQEFRDDQLAGRVHKADLGDISAKTLGEDGAIVSSGPEKVDPERFYVPDAATVGVHLGGRRGPVTQPQSGA